MDVLPTLGTTKLFQTESISEGLLREGLLGQDGGHATRTLLAERWIKQGELLDLAKLFQ